MFGVFGELLGRLLAMCVVIVYRLCTNLACRLDGAAVAPLDVSRLTGKAGRRCGRVRVPQMGSAAAQAFLEGLWGMFRKSVKKIKEKLN